MYQHCQTQVQASNVYNLPSEVKAEADTVGAVEGVGHWMVSESINHLCGNAIILLSEVGEDLSSGRDLLPHLCLIASKMWQLADHTKSVSTF
jgi:hypothetical protein